MKHFFRVRLFPTLLIAQSMQLTEQLGKTVLYGDIALSPRWHACRVGAVHRRNDLEADLRSRVTSGNAAATMVNIGSAGERTDSDPAWSPDSKTFVFPPLAKKNKNSSGP